MSIICKERDFLYFREKNCNISAPEDIKGLIWKRWRTILKKHEEQCDMCFLEDTRFLEGYMHVREKIQSRLVNPEIAIAYLIMAKEDIAFRGTFLNEDAFLGALKDVYQANFKSHKFIEICNKCTLITIVP